MKKTSLIPLLVLCQLYAAPSGTPSGHQAFTPAINHVFSTDGKPRSDIIPMLQSGSGRSTHLASLGENGIVLSLLAVMASLCAIAYQRFIKMKRDIKREKEEAVRKA